MFKKFILGSGLLFIVLVLLAIVFRNQIILHIYYSRLEPPENVQKIPLPKLDPALEKELTDYLKAHFQTPEDYVISKFSDHDIVFLGEIHRLLHDVLLVQRLIPILYKKHIYNLGMEFANYRDQPLIDSLLEAPAYDAALVNKILFNCEVDWGYQEYADLFKVAWQLNQSLPDTAPRFRIVGLNDFEDWSYVKTKEDLNNPQIMAKVFPEGRSGDRFMANVVLKEFVNKKHKALIYCGMHHAFTRFFQPISSPDGGFVRFIKNRMGNIVYQAIGRRAMTISLHFPWDGSYEVNWEQVYPADGAIDALMHKLGPDFYPVGFDTRTTPFGKLSCETSVYHYGYDHLTLADFCDGYIFTKPISQYRNVHHIKGFINKNNVELARLRLSSLELKNNFLWKILSPSTIDSMMFSDALVKPWVVYFY